MIFYLILMALALGGMGGLVFRYRSVVFSSGSDDISKETPTFAIFMEGVSTHMAGIWNDYAKVKIFSLLEKNLRRVRLIMLRAEHSLFRITHRVKDISQRAEEVKAENAAIAAESSQNDPPQVQ